MTQGRKYRNPPIVEALCEIYFEDSKDWDETAPGRFYDLIKDEYPVRERVKDDAEGETASSPRGPMSEARGAPAVRFRSRSGDVVVQAGEDLLVVNKLPPYRSFEEWLPRVIRVLSAYTDVARPARLFRVGVRYVNRVRLPKASANVADYFGVYPSFPKYDGAESRSFELTFDLKPSPERRTLISLEAWLRAQESWFLLDLYASYLPAWSTAAEQERIVAELKAAHHRVVECFEASITDRLRSLIDSEAAA